jgi:hypothetical protein
MDTSSDSERDPSNSEQQSFISPWLNTTLVLVNIHIAMSFGGTLSKEKTILLEQLKCTLESMSSDKLYNEIIDTSNILSRAKNQAEIEAMLALEKPHFIPCIYEKEGEAYSCFFSLPKASVAKLEIDAMELEQFVKDSIDNTGLVCFSISHRIFYVPIDTTSEEYPHTPNKFLSLVRNCLFDQIEDDQEVALGITLSKIKCRLLNESYSCLVIDKKHLETGRNRPYAFMEQDFINTYSSPDDFPRYVYPGVIEESEVATLITAIRRSPEKNLKRKAVEAGDFDTITRVSDQIDYYITRASQALISFPIQHSPPVFLEVSNLRGIHIISTKNYPYDHSITLASQIRSITNHGLLSTTTRQRVFSQHRGLTTQSEPNEMPFACAYLSIEGSKHAVLMPYDHQRTRQATPATIITFDFPIGGDEANPLVCLGADPVENAVYIRQFCDDSRYLIEISTKNERITYTLSTPEGKIPIPHPISDSKECFVGNTILPGLNLLLHYILTFVQKSCPGIKVCPLQLADALFSGRMEIRMSGALPVENATTLTQEKHHMANVASEEIVYYTDIHKRCEEALDRIMKDKRPPIHFPQLDAFVTHIQWHPMCREASFIGGASFSRWIFEELIKFKDLLHLLKDKETLLHLLNTDSVLTSSGSTQFTLGSVLKSVLTMPDYVFAFGIPRNSHSSIHSAKKAEAESQVADPSVRTTLNEMRLLLIREHLLPEQHYRFSNWIELDFVPRIALETLTKYQKSIPTLVGSDQQRFIHEAEYGFEALIYDVLLGNSSRGITIEEFCEMVIKNQVFSNSYYAHLLFDPIHLFYGLQSDKPVTFHDGEFTFSKFIIQLIQTLHQAAQIGDKTSAYTAAQLWVRIQWMEDRFGKTEEV